MVLGCACMVQFVSSSTCPDSRRGSSRSRVRRRFWIWLCEIDDARPRTARPNGQNGVPLFSIIRHDQFQATDRLLIDSGLCSVGVCGPNRVNRVRLLKP